MSDASLIEILVGVAGGYIVGCLLFVACLKAWDTWVGPRLRLHHLERAGWRSAADDWELADLRRRYQRR